MARPHVRLYRVVNGDRQQIASADLDVTAGQWHTLEAMARGPKLTVTWDGHTVIDASDVTFANSVTAFDDLEAMAR